MEVKFVKNNKKQTQTTPSNPPPPKQQELVVDDERGAEERSASSGSQPVAISLKTVPVASVTEDQARRNPPPSDSASQPKRRVNRNAPQPQISSVSSPAMPIPTNSTLLSQDTKVAAGVEESALLAEILGVQTSSSIQPKQSVATTTRPTPTTSLPQQPAKLNPRAAEWVPSFMTAKTPLAPPPPPPPPPSGNEHAVSDIDLMQQLEDEFETDPEVYDALEAAEEAEENAQGNRIFQCDDSDLDSEEEAWMLEQMMLEGQAGAGEEQ